MEKRNNLVAILFLILIFAVPIVSLATGAGITLPKENTKEQEETLEGNGTLINNYDTGKEEEVVEVDDGLSPFESFQAVISHFCENLIGHKEIIEANAQMSYCLSGGNYVESNQVIVGTEGYLFYKSNDNGNPIKDYKGINLFTEEQLSQTAANMVATRDYFANQGIDFIGVIVPNKEIGYSKYMPDVIYRDSEYSTGQQLCDYITNNTDVSFVYPINSILEAADRWEVYYKTDTHLNQLGAFAVFRELYNKLNQSDLSLDDCIYFKDEEKMHTGDLALNSALSQMKEQDEIYVVTDAPAEYKKEGKVLCIGDSFSGFISAVASKYYSDVTWIGIEEYNSAILAEYQPDIVIFESGERLCERFYEINLTER